MIPFIQIKFASWYAIVITDNAIKFWDNFIMKAQLHVLREFSISGVTTSTVTVSNTLNSTLRKSI